MDRADQCRLENVRRQVAALAAEGKLSAWVLGGLSPWFMVYRLLTNHNYVIVSFQKPFATPRECSG